LTEDAHSRHDSPPALDPKVSALFLYLDGSIAEIVARPDEVVPDALLTSIGVGEQRNRKLA
jgi:trehalose-6-phosphatase